MKARWSEVRRGDVVELKGEPWNVVAVKAKKKGVHVEVERNGRHASSRVDPAAKVTVTARARPATSKRPATHPSRRGLGPGDPSVVAPPATAAGDLWGTQQDRIEGDLQRILGATLIGESKDEASGFYVPPVDVTTVAGHMVTFHGGIPEACEDEGAMLVAHDAQHQNARKGEGVLAVNHWHTDRRP